ncbi:hypothetical protein PDE_02354 [Penicillium oxalicum 114-2]|uniref:DNA endonuclease activator Ctp1 C-terminal domain-containing protein n=1 Tax=Penicillium oxalicum (strain 114-2 / CGMCC 5302) TaxID=933388 RepID=S7ZFJ1_PENO1|nr:hypothetical protein PDE_02354 [Penicillium oxalicum 114-2]
MEIFNDLQASIAEACATSISDAQKKFDAAVTAQQKRLEEAETHLSSALEAQKAAEERANNLQRHVDALKDELNTHKASPKELEPPTAIPNLERDFAPGRVWKNEEIDASRLRDILETKYSKLYEGLQAFVQSWSSLKAVTLQHKKKLQTWERQLKKDSFTITLDNSTVTFTRSTNADGESVADGGEIRASMRRRLADEHPGPEENRPRSRRLDHDENVHRTKPATATWTRPAEPIRTGKSKSFADSSLVTATQETLTSDGLSSESSSGLPSNLQTRKRKRVQPSGENELRQGAPEKPVLIKSETLSSSPVQPGAMAPGCLAHFPSTQDLDEIGGVVQTPTKKQAFKEIPWDTEHQYSDRKPNVSTPSRPTQPVGVLQPIDGNVPSLRSRGQGSTAKKPRSSATAALMMAEDGDSGDFQTSPRKRAKTPIRNATPKVKHDGNTRLQDLLEGSSSSKPSFPSSKRAAGHRVDERNRSNKSHANARKSALPGPEKTQTDYASQAGLEVQPEEEPYRSRPLNRLGLHHFKINPAANAGLDYAYDDVIRKKDDRKCMSGCTRPGCCGDRFRAMARMAIQGSNKTAAQNEEEQRIVEDFIGENGASLVGMTERQHEQIRVEALARHYANQYGRHRHTHQRARSPPGFWRTEMPSTQEIEADRENARKMEREKVEERYREAMRPGGVWTWADE